MSSLQSLLSWFSFGARFVVGLAVLGVALGPIRRAHTNAGLALAAAVGIDVALLLAWRVGILVLQVGSGAGSFSAMFTVLNLLSIGATMATGALVATSMVLLAEAARGRS